MNLNATQFDRANACACAQASADAYLKSSVSDPATDTHCLVLELPDAVVIAFRGTNSIRNWITDADFKRQTLTREANGDDCEVHAGFLAAFDGIVGPLTDYLKTCGDISASAANIESNGGARRDAATLARGGDAKPVFVTGHSLGGALAILAALELTRRNHRVAQVYTFGQPRVGNSAFKHLYESTVKHSTEANEGNKDSSSPSVKTFRVVYQEDIVPRIPHLPAWHDPYRHLGTEVFLPSFQSAIGNRELAIPMRFNPPWWYLLASDLWGLGRAFAVSNFRGALDPALDHHINHYLIALAALQPPKAGAQSIAAGVGAPPVPSINPAIH